MVLSFMPPQIPSQLKSCYSCGLEGEQASVSALPCSRVCVYKISCGKGFKTHGSQWHGGRTLEAHFAAKSTSQEHKFWRLQTCKHQCRLSLQIVSAKFSFPDLSVFLIDCFWFMAVTENIMKWKNKSIYVNKIQEIKLKYKNQPTPITSRPNIWCSAEWLFPIPHWVYCAFFLLGITVRYGFDQTILD